MSLSQAEQQESDSDQEKKRYRPRRAYIALLLSLCPGLGQQYAGHLYRGILAYISLIFVSWLAAIAYMYAKSMYVSLIILFAPFIYALFISIDAARCAIRQPSTYRLKWYNKSWVYMGVFAFLLVTVNPLMDLMIGRHVVRAFFVTTESMSPAVLKHDFVVINKLEKPLKNDVVLINFGENQTDSSISKIINDQTLRRVIAEPGDEVEIQGRQVYVNGVQLDEPYAVYGKTISPNIFTSKEFHWGPDVVPKGALFVLSDARQYGFDSRIIGFIDSENVGGIATKVFWSWNLVDGYFKWERTAMIVD